MGDKAQGTLFDLSPPLDARTALYPGDPPFSREWHCTLERDGANVSRLGLGAHAGSHVDAPLHFLTAGSDIASMPLDAFFGPAVVIDAPKAPGQDVTLADLPLATLRRGDIVLFRTGWEERAGTPRFFADPWPGITLEAVEALIEAGVKAVGGDLPSADSPAALDAGAPAHRRLAEAGIPIFECLAGLAPIIGRRVIFAGFPLKITGGEASPIRAVAWQA